LGPTLMIVAKLIVYRLGKNLNLLENYFPVLLK